MVGGQIFNKAGIPFRMRYSPVFSISGKCEEIMPLNTKIQSVIGHSQYPEFPHGGYSCKRIFAKGDKEALGIVKDLQVKKLGLLRSMMLEQSPYNDNPNPQIPGRQEI